jgi:hypothetical protein
LGQAIPCQPFAEIDRVVRRNNLPPSVQRGGSGRVAWKRPAAIGNRGKPLMKAPAFQAHTLLEIGVGSADQVLTARADSA